MIILVLKLVEYRNLLTSINKLINRLSAIKIKKKIGFKISNFKGYFSTSELYKIKLDVLIIFIFNIINLKDYF